MLFLIGLGVLLAAAAVLSLRNRSTIGKPRVTAGGADDVRAAVKRYRTRAASGSHPCEDIDDARLAAAGMMSAIAGMDGPLTKAQIDAIRVECRAAFRVVQREADEIAAFGRWLAEEAEDPEDALSRLSPKVRALAPAEAQRDLIRMLERVAAVEGGVSAEQRQAITTVRRRMANA
ncbi:MAG: TerB family tellurite resistance protein [Pseudomonadota bacterium]